MTPIERLTGLYRARNEAKAEAEACEQKAAAALERGNREAWEHFSHAASAAWERNAEAVASIDRIEATAEGIYGR